MSGCHRRRDTGRSSRLVASTRRAYDFLNPAQPQGKCSRAVVGIALLRRRRADSPLVRSRRPSFSAFGHLLAAAAMFFLAGGHWGALQAVAWAGMLWNYSQQSGSLAAGVAKTFDGAHPCSLCHSIKRAQGEERKVPASSWMAKKLESFPAPAQALVPWPPCGRSPRAKLVDEKAPVRSAAPPSPIPIA